MWGDGEKKQGAKDNYQEDAIDFFHGFEEGLPLRNAVNFSYMMIGAGVFMKKAREKCTKDLKSYL